MIPALSTRLAEPPGRKDAALVPLGEFARLARGMGYRALSVRASQVSIGSSEEEVERARRALDEAGVGVVMVTGTVSLAANDTRATEPLRNITPHLDLAERLGSRLVRVMLQREEDIPFATRAAAEAGERGMKLAHQTHIGTLCETVDGTLEVLERVGSPHFGITFEPSNLLVSGSIWGREAVKRLAPRVVNVYLQNWRAHAGGALTLQLNAGPVKADQIALDDASGVDYVEVFDALREIGWEGYVTVHQSLMPGETVEGAARAHMAAVQRLLEGA
ncbi:MAG TPA: sugar phosphate isomerase/epimerase [Chloroflexota bacterium]|nr:sugar phosphate isomerase/epimerase [Chloroflexota bacterium]